MFRIWFVGLKKSEIELEKDKIVNKYDEFLEENFEMASRNEQEAAETTIEKKTKWVSKTILQNVLFAANSHRNWSDKKEETETYLKTDFEYFSKEIKSINKLKLEKRKKKLVHWSLQC